MNAGMKKNNLESRKSRFLNFTLDHISLFILVFIVILGTIASNVFLSGQNLLNILKQITINGILATGFTYVLLTGGFDLSLGANTSLCACLLIGLQNSGLNMYLTIAIVILVGMSVGVMNGTIMRLIRAELSDIFMVTLGTSLLVYSIALTYSKGYELYIKNPAFTVIGKGSLFGIIPYSVVIMAVLMIAAQIILSKTSLGRKMYLVGGSKNVSFLAGINVNNIRSTAFIFAGFTAAIAAIVMTSRTTSANSHCATGYEFDAVIASIIGGIALGGGRGDISNTLIGVLIMGIIVNIMNLTGIPSVVQLIVKGVILIIMIYVGVLQQRPKQMRIIKQTFSKEEI